MGHRTSTREGEEASSGLDQDPAGRALVLKVAHQVLHGLLTKLDVAYEREHASQVGERRVVIAAVDDAVLSPVVHWTFLQGSVDVRHVPLIVWNAPLRTRFY